MAKNNNWKNPALYKTRLCDFWSIGQECKYGNRCWYAHGPHELRCVPHLEHNFAAKTVALAEVVDLLPPSKDRSHALNRASQMISDAQTNIFETVTKPILNSFALQMMSNRMKEEIVGDGNGQMKAEDKERQSPLNNFGPLLMQLLSTQPPTTTGQGSQGNLAVPPAQFYPSNQGNPPTLSYSGNPSNQQSQIFPYVPPQPIKRQNGPVEFVPRQNGPVEFPQPSLRQNSADFFSDPMFHEFAANSMFQNVPQNTLFQNVPSNNSRPSFVNESLIKRDLSLSSLSPDSSNNSGTFISSSSASSPWPTTFPSPPSVFQQKYNDKENQEEKKDLFGEKSLDNFYNNLSIWKND